MLEQETYRVKKDARERELKEVKERKNIDQKKQMTDLRSK